MLCTIFCFLLNSHYLTPCFPFKSFGKSKWRSWIRRCASTSASWSVKLKWLCKSCPTHKQVGFYKFQEKLDWAAVTDCTISVAKLNKGLFQRSGTSLLPSCSSTISEAFQLSHMDKKMRRCRRHICGSHRTFLFIFSLARIQSQFPNLTARKAKRYCFSGCPGKGSEWMNT